MLIVGENTYITLTEANDIMSGFLNTTEWDESDDTTKEKALRQACSYMNNLDYIGVKTDNTQILQFPRYFVSQGGWLQDMGVPENIKTGQAMLALYMLKPNKSSKIGVKSESVDGIGSITYSKALSDDVIFKPAYDFISMYIERCGDLT